MSWLKDKFGQQAEDLVEKIKGTVVTEHVHQERLAICESCDKLQQLHICSECHCYMPLKTKFSIFNCPLKKW
jgi:hypothetical protein